MTKDTHKPVQQGTEPTQQQQEQQHQEVELHPGIAKHNPTTNVQEYFVATDS